MPLVQTFEEFVKTNLISQENSQKLRLLEDKNDLSDVLAAYKIIKEINTELANEENLNLLIQHAKQAKNIAEELKALNRATPSLAIQKNLEILINIKRPQAPASTARWRRVDVTKVSTLSAGLLALHKADPMFVTQDNFLVLCQSILYAREIAEVIIQLTTAKQGNLADHENLYHLTQHAENAGNIASLLKELNGHVTKNIFTFLLKHSTEKIRNILRQTSLNSPENLASVLQLCNVEHIDNVTFALNLLYMQQIFESTNLLTSDTLNLLIQHPEQATSIAAALVEFNKSTPTLDTPENRAMLIINKKYAGDIALALKALRESAYLKKLSIQQNVVVLFQNAEYASNIAALFTQLSQLNPTLAIQLNFDLLIQHCDFSQALQAQISEEKSFTQTSFMKLLEGFNTVKKELSQINPDVVTRENLNQLNLNAQYMRNVIELFKVLKETNHSCATQEKFDQLIREAKYTGDILLIFKVLKEVKPDLATSENLELFIQHAEHTHAIFKGLQSLIMAGPMFVSQHNLVTLTQAPQYAEDIATVLIQLSMVGRNNQIHRDLLIQHAPQASGISSAINSLDGNIREGIFQILIDHAINIAEITDNASMVLNQIGLSSSENLTLLLRYIEHINKTLNALIKLHEAQVQGVLDININLQDLLELLCHHSEYADNVADGLILLSTLPNINTPANKALLTEIENGKYADGIASVLICFNKVTPSLDTPENRALLIQHVEHTKGMVKMFDIWRRVVPNIATPHNLTNLFQHAPYANGVAKMFSALLKWSPALATQANLDRLFQHAPEAQSLCEVYKQLIQLNPEFATQKTLDTLIKYRYFSKDILEKLSRTKPANQNDFEKLLEIYHTSSDVSDVLSQGVRTTKTADEKGPNLATLPYELLANVAAFFAPKQAPEEELKIYTKFEVQSKTKPTPKGR